MNMKIKLIVLILAATIIPLFAIMIIAVNQVEQLIMEEAFNRLLTTRDIKKNQIKNFFEEKWQDVLLLSTNSAVLEAFKAAETAFLDNGNRVDNSEWNGTEKKDVRWLEEYVQINGYYDLFLINSSGDVLYTVAKESDWGENLIQGELKNSPLAKLFLRASNEAAFQDFEPYRPSSDAPSSFIGAPLRENGETIGVLALQLPVDEINALTQERIGMGETGEIYLVGPDNRMRSDSYLDPVGHTIKASFAGTIEHNGVDTEASRRALAGKSGVRSITDYVGNSVLSAFTPLELFDVRWALITEIDESEIKAPLKRFIMVLLIININVIIVVMFIVLFVVRQLQGPGATNNLLIKKELIELQEKLNYIINRV